MIISLIKTIYGNIIARMERFTRYAHWEIKVTLIAVLIALFFSFPNYYQIPNFSVSAWKCQLNRFTNPLLDTSRTYGGGDHFSKTNFRIAIPIIAHVFRFRMPQILVLQFFVGIILFYFICRIVEEITKDRVVALLSCLMVACIYSGIAAFVDLYSFFDAFAIFFLVAALFFKNPIMIGIGVFLSAWTDERGLIASGLVLLYYAIDTSSRKLLSASSWRKPVIFSIIFFWFLYCAIRSYMSGVLKLSTTFAGTGISHLIGQNLMIYRSVVSGLEGGWFLVILSLVVLFKRKSYSLFFLYSISMLIIVGIALCLDDKVRSIAYILPAFFIALKILTTSENKEELRVFCTVALLISFFWPNFQYTGGSEATYFRSFPYYLVFTILRQICGPH